MSFSDLIKIFCIISGVFCCFTGYLMWKKQNMKFLNKNNYAKVKVEDMPMYTKKIGQGNILLGFNVIWIVLFNEFFDSWIGLLVFVTIMILSFYIQIKAQLKYNGSII